MKAESPVEANVDALRMRLDQEAESAGYHLNPDLEFTRSLTYGLLVNESRYGYRACPCRLASGEVERDRDIVCPCDYRDADLLDWGGCFCGLYVSTEVREGKMSLVSVPERRPTAAERALVPNVAPRFGRVLSLPVWRCRVCGYLCARQHPPAVCPICKATSDRFEAFA
jgi:ferredoxin-thioredoxin reductase catalytic subunit